MRFAVFALATVPDTATARRLFELDDLDDKSVAKVLFHQRKQQTGSSEELRWDQRAIAGLTLIHHTRDHVRLETMDYSGHSEDQMLHAFYRAMLHDAPMVSWGSAQAGLPLLHFRTLMHGLSYPTYWQALKSGSELHLDVRDWLSPAGADRPALDETARKLGLPGLMAASQDSVLSAWLQGQSDPVQAFSELSALNVYLLALRIFVVRGLIGRSDSGLASERLRDALSGLGSDHLARFLAAWRGA